MADSGGLPDPTRLVARSDHPSLGSTAAGGGALTLAMVMAKRGSAWPTAFFFFGGMALPAIVAWILWRLGVRRYPRVLALVASLLVLGVVSWVGEHPSPAAAFRDVTGVELAQDAEVIRVERGWSDGMTTVIRFRASIQTVRKLMAATDDQLRPSATTRVLDESMRKPELAYELAWSGAVAWAVGISPETADPPQWTKPRMSHWMHPFGGGDRGVWFLWDDASGEAIVYDGSD